MTPSPYFIVSYTALGRPRKTACQIVGEHDGDIKRGAWTCCGEEEEVIDCDTCLDPGDAANGLPPGWIEDTNGKHCPRCQPGGN